MEYQQITEKIIGCAYAVYNKMGYGFLESVYEKCMLIELAKAKVNATAQRPVTVFYEGHIVGDFIADLLVEDKVLVELKSVRRLVQAHEVQLVNYLTATDTEVGLLLNFAERNVEVKRRTRTLPQEADF